MPKSSLIEFSDKINEIMPVIAREFIRHQVGELSKGKITLPQLLALDFVQKQSELKMTDLAHLLGVTTAAITGIAGRMVKYGYLVRVFDPADRRIIKVKLTPKGEQLLNKVNRARREMVVNVFSKISQAEREEYLKILTHVYEALAQEKIITHYE
jgi:DNA-binding MarR family transcriptional regulator